MTALELSKAEKKLARQIIESGLQKEYANSLLEAEKIIEQWKQGKLDDKEAYVLLYKEVQLQDKHIGNRYDKISGSNYLYIIAGQLADKIITLEDINPFSEETKQKLYLLSGLNDSL